MPFTRISLLAGKSSEYLAAISASLDRALVECFETPENDRFAIIHQHQPNELIFDPTYKGGPRSPDFTLFHVTTGKVRSPETKRAFYSRLVERLAEAPGIRPEDVMVVVANSALDDWSFSSGLCAGDDGR
ncbi:tautomerase family protein [Bradyrhizobium sp. USDA 4473]